MKARSRWGLWQRMLSYPAVSEIHVYPDMQQLAQVRDSRAHEPVEFDGGEAHRKIGTDNEFERLRD